MTNPVDWTFFVGVVVAASGGVIVPVWFQRRKQREATDTATVLSWSSMTAALQAERDKLQTRLDELEDRHRQQLKERDHDWETRMADARGRITQLEQEVTALSAMLRSRP